MHEILETEGQENNNLDEGPSKGLPKLVQVTKHIATSSEKQRTKGNCRRLLAERNRESDMWNRPNPQGRVLPPWGPRKGKFLDLV